MLLAEMVAILLALGDVEYARLVLNYLLRQAATAESLEAVERLMTCGEG